MKATNKKIATELLPGLMTIGKLDLKEFQLNYAISRNVKKLETIALSFEKSEKALYKEYFLPGDDGAYSIPKTKELLFEFDQKQTELNNMEHEIKLFKVKLSQLKSIQGITAQMLYLIDDIIEVDTEVLTESETTTI